MKYEIDLHTFAKKLNYIMDEKKITNIDLYNLLYPSDKIDKNCGGQYVRDKTRKIDNWIKGKNYPKNISDILLLCNCLECDLDYFFTNVKEKTHDTHFICGETGLSEKIVNTIIDYNKAKENTVLSDFTDTLNSLLCDSDNILYFLGAVSEYRKKNNLLSSIIDRDLTEKELGHFELVKEMFPQEATEKLKQDIKVTNSNYRELEKEKEYCEYKATQRLISLLHNIDKSTPNT